MIIFGKCQMFMHVHIYIYIYIYFMLFLIVQFLGNIKIRNASLSTKSIKKRKKKIYKYI